MSTVNVLDLKGQTVGQLELRDDIFGMEPNRDLMFRYVDQQLASRRQGTASTKTRAEVSGTGKKPWPQKHTHRARQGSLRGPHMRHGGVAFGPKPRDWSKGLNRKMKVQALKSALSTRVKEGNLIVLEDFTMDSIKTKAFKQVLQSLGIAETKSLFVLPYKKEGYLNVRLSSRNLGKCKVLIADNPGMPERTTIDGLNVFDIINNEKLVLTRDTVKKIEEVLGNGR
ncbi:MAG TPA: 50S ribosomal protein L4 [Thermotogota bacterium]|nr:50S ribosomal protein L4 [Thermotogota bacterium]HRW91375.1 50S ribosomal protein L4 [Thermotogota bacterium]